MPSGCLLSVCSSGGGNMWYFRASSGGIFQGAGAAGEEGYSRAKRIPVSCTENFNSCTISVQRGNTASVLGSLGFSAGVTGQSAQCFVGLVILFCFALFCCRFCFVHWVLFLLKLCYYINLLYLLYYSIYLLFLLYFYIIYCT